MEKWIGVKALSLFKVIIIIISLFPPITEDSTEYKETIQFIFSIQFNFIQANRHISTIGHLQVCTREEYGSMT